MRWYSIAASLATSYGIIAAKPGVGKIELKSYRRMFQAVQQVFFDDAIGHHPSGQEHMAHLYGLILSIRPFQGSAHGLNRVKAMSSRYVQRLSSAKPGFQS